MEGIMHIYFYNWAGSPNVINKNLSAEPNLSLEGVLREECSIEEPSILIQSDPRGQNYVYIPEFSRYYFITDITAERNNAYRVELHVDVLQSFASQIKNLDVFGRRTACGIQTKNIVDPNAPIEATEVIDPDAAAALGAHDFSHFILVTVG